jgi:D-alanyl-D-alanine carboxypeptidase/D-alanyl-D-alanine-endopeptidase (penicillin-binding protein 4)
VWEPEKYFLELFRDALEKHGVAVHGITRIDTSRPGFVLGTVAHTLDSVLHRINKPSDNLGAEILLKTLGIAESGGQGTAEGGLGVVKKYLAGTGVDTTRLILADGSGMSFYDAISPDAIIKLLTAQSGEAFRRLYESLPVAGVDGTLKNRMRHGPAFGNVHAKTGSLTGVSALSGYVTTADHELLAFSMMCNHFPAEIVPLRAAQDSIMQILAGLKERK